MSSSLKREIEKDFNQEKNYNAVLNEIERMNIMKNFKIRYAVGAICAVSLVGVIGLKSMNLIPANSNINQLENENQGTINMNEEQLANGKFELNVNEISDMANLKLDVDMRMIETEDLSEKYNFIKNIKIPSKLTLQNVYNVYTRKDFNTEHYDILHDYVFSYGDDNTKNITIKCSEIEEPLRDYFIKNQEQKSIINNVEFEISQYQDMYIATFSDNAIYFDIETKGISETELVELLQSIVSGKQD